MRPPVHLFVPFIAVLYVTLGRMGMGELWGEVDVFTQCYSAAKVKLYLRYHFILIAILNLLQTRILFTYLTHFCWFGVA